MRVWEAGGLEQGWEEWTERGPPLSHYSITAWPREGGVFSQEGGREEEEGREKEKIKSSLLPV